MTTGRFSSRSLNDLAEYRSDSALALELPYWDFLDDLVVLADGSFALGYRLKGLAIETWTLEQINNTTVCIRDFLNSLPDGCELSIVTDSNSDFDSVIGGHDSCRSKNESINWLIEQRVASLRRDSNDNFLLKPNLYLFVYRRFDPSPKSAFTSLWRAFFSSPKLFQTKTRGEHESAERELRQNAASVRERLESFGVTTRALTGNEILELLYKFINPKRSKDIGPPKLNLTFREQEFLPEEVEKIPSLSLPSPREQLIFSDLVQGYDSFFVDGYHHRVITVKTLPEFTHSALISRLMQLPFPNLLHVHLQVPEQSKELASLQTKRRMAHSMSAGQSGRASDLESEARLQSTEELLRELINTGQKIFYFQTSVLIRSLDKDDLDAKTKAVLSSVRSLNGAEALAETVAGFKVWKTMLPLGNTTLVRPKRAKTDNLADFLPLYEPYLGSERSCAKPVCIFRNRSNGLVAYDPFDPSLPNYNTLVTGSSGSGKSFLNNLVLLQYLSQNPSLFIIDIGGSYRKLCEFLGGQYIEIAPPEAGQHCKSINPFELASGVTEPSPQKIKFLLALLENMLTDSDTEKLPKLDRSLLEEAVLNLYKQFSGVSPRLSDLVVVLAESKEAHLRDYARMLYPWTGDRPYGRLLDGRNELDLSAKTVVFDLKGLASYPDLQAVMILIITDFILGRVAASRENVHGRILLDECWELLKSHGSSQFMEYCVRTLRKTGWGITFITQGLEEIVASPIGGAILSNTATKFILQQKGDLEPTRKILKLNDQELSLISSLKQVKGRYSEAFLVANEDRAVIRVFPTPSEYWLATSDATDNALFSSAREAFPEKDLAQIVHWLASQYPNGSYGVTKILNKGESNEVAS